MPLAETDADGNVTRYYVWAGFRLLAHIAVDGGGDPVVRCYHTDELGSTLALTDGNGDVTDEFAYTPYGGVTHTGSTETPYQWLGGYGVYYDIDTQLHLTLHRAYSCSLRRFISTDPMGIDGGVNLYAYGNLNPLAFVDPYGLCAESWGSKAMNTVNSVLSFPGNALNQFREVTGIASANNWMENNVPGYKATGDFLGRPDVQMGMMLAVGTTYQAAPQTAFTFRGDARGPNTIFNEGFSARGSSQDLFAHAVDNTRPASAYISTSKSADIAAGFADNVYVVRPRGGLDVNQILGSRSPFPNELEVAVPLRISPSDIRGATLPNQGMSVLNPNWTP